MSQSIMMKYIEESKNIIEKIFHSEQITSIVNEIDFSLIERVIFVGSGSSDNAAVVSKYDFKRYTDFEVTNYTPEQFVEAKLPTDITKTIIIFTSATGNSRWTNLALEHAKDKGYKTIAISAAPDSLFIKKADKFINLLSGEENSYAKTKGYNATLLTIKLLGLEIGKKKKELM